MKIKPARRGGVWGCRWWCCGLGPPSSNSARPRPTHRPPQPTETKQENRSSTHQTWHPCSAAFLTYPAGTVTPASPLAAAAAAGAAAPPPPLPPAPCPHPGHRQSPADGTQFQPCSLMKTRVISLMGLHMRCGVVAPEHVASPLAHRGGAAHPGGGLPHSAPRYYAPHLLLSTPTIYTHTIFHCLPPSTTPSPTISYHPLPTPTH